MKSQKLFVFFLLIAGLLHRTSLIDHRFPLNDGGMFTSIIIDILNNNFLPPTHLSYNQLHLPFAYPPIGFFISANLIYFLETSPQLAGIYIPLIFTALTPALSYIILKKLGLKNQLIPLSCLLLLIIPRSYHWQIMGGGISRASGLLFSLMAIALAIKPSITHLLLSGTFIGLTWLTHLEAGIFATLSVTLISIKSRKVKNLLVANLTACLVVLPWISLINRNFSLAPLINAFHSGEWNMLTFLFNFALFFSIGEGPPFILSILGIFGMIMLLVLRKPFVVVWFFMILLTNQRGGGNYATIPAAILITTGFKHIHRLSHHRWFIVAITFIGLVNLIITPYVQSADNTTLKSLNEAELNSMFWVKHHTQPNSKFVIVPKDAVHSKWYSHGYAEWFPLLAGRQSVSTTQGLEWLDSKLFNDTAIYNEHLFACHKSGINCLSAKPPLGDFTHLVIYKSDKSQLLKDLQSSHRFTQIYENKALKIFEHTPR